jgi:hypothetical protein
MLLTNQGVRQTSGRREWFRIFRIGLALQSRESSWRSFWRVTETSRLLKGICIALFDIRVGSRYCSVCMDPGKGLSVGALEGVCFSVLNTADTPGRCSRANRKVRVEVRG